MITKIKSKDWTDMLLKETNEMKIGDDDIS